MTDPIADMITRIRNANMVYKDFTDIPYSKMKEGIASVLKDEGYIKDFEVIEEGNKKILRVHLLYFPGKRKKRAITEIKKVSKPGARVYVGKDQIPKVKDGLGIAILTTSKGLMSDKKAREVGIGGELLITVW